MLCFVLFEIFFTYVGGQVYDLVCAGVRCSGKPEEGVRSPGAGLTGGFELPDVGAEVKLSSEKTEQVLLNTNPSPDPK